MIFIGRLSIFFLCLWLAGCSSSNRIYDVSSSNPNPIYKVGKPYKVAGKVYRPEANPNYDQTGLASWYGSQFHGRKTANGDIFNMNGLTAAHTTLPMPSYVRVTNLANGRWLILKINDRGPFVGNRLIDVSRRAAQLLGFEKKGVTRIRVQAVDGPSGKLPPQTYVKRHPKIRKIPVKAVKIKPVVQQVLAEEENTINNKNMAEGKKIYVQIGAYADKRNAVRVVDTINNMSNTKIDKVDINGQNLYRVRIGPQPTIEFAENILGKILSLGHNTARIILDY